jgi:hypothetical protein
MTFWSGLPWHRFTHCKRVTQTFFAQRLDFLDRHDRKSGGKPPHSKRGLEAKA